MNSRRYTVAIKSLAEREIRRFSADFQERISHAILRLETDPRPVGCRKLSVMDRYRIRVGDYRILYTVDHAQRQVNIVSVEHRREAYRRR